MLIRFNDVYTDTCDADGVGVGRNVEQMVADKMERFDVVAERQVELLDGVDLVVDQTEAADVAHVGEHVPPDRSKIRLLDAQQLMKQCRLLIVNVSFIRPG